MAAQGVSFASLHVSGFSPLLDSPGPGLLNNGTMGIDPELLEILACPECKDPVRLVHDETGLKCGTCRRVFPIRDDIPIMLLDEATTEDEDQNPPKS